MLWLILAAIAYGLTLAFAEQKSPQSKRGQPDKEKPDHDSETDKPDDLSDLTETRSETRHSVTIGGKTLRYTATAGLLPLREELGKPKAHVFYVAYTRQGVQPERRPITFCFNGGPGSASVWLHLGAFGPQRVVVPEPPEAPQPPFKLAKNAETLLDLTDLVFVDPVSTGFSRPAKEEDREQFHGVQEDVEWVGEFVRLFTTRYGRWGSPKFLAGESYGTLRAAALGRWLQSRHGMYLNGIIFISTVLNTVTLDFERGNDIGHVLLLPTLAATAWYHGRIDKRRALDRLLADTESFAQTEYAAALFHGSELSRKQRDAIVRRLVELTGFTGMFVEEADLRLTVPQVVQHLLRDERRTVGRLDSRYTGLAHDLESGRSFGDPSLTALQGAYATLLNHYVRQTLQFESDLPYEVLTRRVHPWKWTYQEGSRGYVTVIPALREAMTVNPHLKLFVASGYYDMATPYFAAEHTLNHLGLPAERMADITRTFYPAGHMLYTDDGSRKALKRDLQKFYRAAM